MFFVKKTRSQPWFVSYKDHTFEGCGMQGFFLFWSNRQLQPSGQPRTAKLSMWV